MSEASRRTWLAPSVIQTSALDCGPAALASVLRGFGLPGDYARLRELCHTDVDGTSIDAIEVVAQRLGLVATQVLVPEDHLFVGPSALPAIVVVRLANGLTHFCVVWRKFGPWLQVMDPARGRRWVWGRSWLRNVYRHRIRVPGEAYLEWARSDDFSEAQRRRGRTLGLGAKQMDTLLPPTSADAARFLDGALRLATTLHRAGAWSRWRGANRLQRLLRPASDPPVPKPFLRARRAPGNGDDLVVQGAVAVRLSGPAGNRAPAVGRRWRRSEGLERLGALFGTGYRQAFGYLVIATGLAAALLVLEVLIFRFLITPVVQLQPLDVRGLIAVAVGAAAALTLTLEDRLTAAGQRLGRVLDVSLRQRLLERLPRIEPRYFVSRLSADLASRAHSIYRLRALPGVGRQILQTGVQIALTGAALWWLNPSAGGLVAALLLGAVAIPICFQRWQAEHDLTARTHSGALSRFYLASLRGLTAIRAHGAEQALTREHEALLTRWGRVSQRLLRLNLLAFVLQSAVCTLLAGAIVLSAIKASGGTAAALLVTYWALRIPPLAQSLADLLRQVPALKTTALRTSEPLTAPIWPSASMGLPTSPTATGNALNIENMKVVAGGRTLLEVDTLRIRRGERVAIVGRSGAGKSTLLRTVLGLIDHDAERLEVFGVKHCPENISAIRRGLNWLDPDVWLYDASVLDNLLFGAREGAATVEQQVEAAGLSALLARRSQGVELQVGEGGARVSGGEGQRLRFGRALGQGTELFLWDEAFRGLEQGSRVSLLRQSFARWPTGTLLYVTHDMNEALQHFERVLVVQAGRIVQDGAPKELIREHNGAFAQLWRFEEERAATLADPNWQRWRLGDGTLTVEPAHGNDRQPRLV